jgi:hypothetical protein
VVPGTVNVETIGLNKDHNSITKFPSLYDNDFIIVSSILQDMTIKAPPAIANQWSEFREKNSKYWVPE